MQRKTVGKTMALLAVTMLTGTVGGAAWAASGQIQKNCAACHEAKDNTLWGLLQAGSQRDDSFAIRIDGTTWQLKYDKNSKLNKMKSVVQLRDDEAIMVKVQPTGTNQGYVEEFSYKPNLSFMEPEMVIELDDLANLLKKDPKEANYVVFDVRGYGDYIDGHLPGAVSLPYYRMNAFVDRLPKDKNTHIITYCNSYG